MPADLLNYALAMLFASLTGTGAYLVCRAEERRNDFFPYFGLIAWVCIEGILLVAVPGNSLLPWGSQMAILLIFGLFGGWAHRLSGGASKDWFDGLCTSLVSMVMSGIFCVFSIWLSHIWIRWSWSQNVFNFYLAGVVIYPVLTPLTVWAWRSLRLRPGLDEPVASVELPV